MTADRRNLVTLLKSASAQNFNKNSQRKTRDTFFKAFARVNHLHLQRNKQKLFLLLCSFALSTQVTLLVLEPFELLSGFPAKGHHICCFYFSKPRDKDKEKRMLSFENSKPTIRIQGHLTTQTCSNLVEPTFVE